MKCRLITSAREFVQVVDLPPFNKPPEIIVWGERFFSLDSETMNNDPPEYIESFTYFVPIET